MSVVCFCCWVSSFSLIFPHCTKLNRMLKISEEQLRCLTRYYEVVDSDTGGSGLHPTCYIILEIKI